MIARYESTFKDFRLAVVRVKDGWQPEVISSKTGESFGDIVPGSEGETLIAPKLTPYPRYLAVGEAQEKACSEATMLAGVNMMSCTEAKLEWKVCRTALRLVPLTGSRNVLEGGQFDTVLQYKVSGLPNGHDAWIQNLDYPRALWSILRFRDSVPAENPTGGYRTAEDALAVLESEYDKS